MGIGGKNTDCKEKPLLLFSALDWGLGHTTRSIPLIHEFLELGCEIVIACNSIQKNILQAEFPSLHYENLPGYDVRYSNGKWSTRLMIGVQLGKILTRINREKRWVRAFVAENAVSGLISDNRYGFHHRTIPSVLITHQLSVRTGAGWMANEITRRFLKKYITKFNECWVPDVDQKKNLAGSLSRTANKLSNEIKYLGPLSRFERCSSKNESEFDVVIILSGPEPQRSILENVIIEQLITVNERIALVRGLPAHSDQINIRNITVYNFLDTAQLQKLICSAELVICRSGYTSVMDLIKLQKKMILIPTPGQAEQEYLAKHLAKEKLAWTVSQRKLDLGEAIIMAKKFSYQFIDYSMTDYKTVVKDFVDRISS